MKHSGAKLNISCKSKWSQTWSIKMTDNNQNAQPSTNPKRKRNWIFAITGICLLVAGIFVTQAVLSSKSYAHMKLFLSERTELDSFSSIEDAHWRGGDDRRGGKGWGRHGRGDGHGFFGRSRFSNLSDEEIEDRVTRLMKHVSIEIDATSEQEEKIIGLVVPAVIEMKSLRGTMKETRDQIEELFSADTIDATAIEELRAQRIADVDRISKTWTNVATEVASTLTLEQREMLQDRMGDFRGWR